MTNQERYYPNAKPESFRVGKSPLAHEPDDSRYCTDCDDCLARKMCEEDKDHKTCIDTFESWLRKEA